MLIACGYNTFLSLSSLDVDKLKIVEQYINRNKDLTANLNCCFSEEYTNKENFEFLPGHESVILRLPGLIEEIRKNKPTKLKNLSKNTRTKEELIDLLINNLLKYSGKQGFQFPEGSISQINIREVEGDVEHGNIKCKFSCPFCPKIIPIKYKSFWESSNITAHLKSHINERNWTNIFLCYLLTTVSTKNNVLHIFGYII